VTDPIEPSAAREPSRRARVQAALARARELPVRLEGSRPKHVSIDVGFRWLVRDKQIAGGVLGGGLAYRFFFWMLALTLLVSGGLGFASRSGANVDAAVEEAGLTEAMSASIATAAEQSETGRWWLLLLGAFFTLWFSFGLLRALRLVHAAAWRIVPPPLRNAPAATAAVVVAPFALLFAAAGAGWVRTNVGLFPGFLATLSVAVGFAAAWLWVSMRLPAPDVRWTAFVPGAVCLGVGLEALHLFTVYFLEDKLASASELYGALGVASTALFYLFLIGRGVVWAAELNAVVWEVRHHPVSKETEV
jgi:hypothetical protein